ncbi:MAG: TetR/AcrR family transcriptional regulator [Microthrixaceae bacterium]
MATDAPERASKGERTRRAILGAAVQRFASDGYRTASVADIARDAGVGGSLPYAYFQNKADLFLAALDEDTAALMAQGLANVTDDPEDRSWRENLVFTLVAALEDHPLAKRVLAGLEPEATYSVIDLPALAELSKAVVERLRSEQATGAVRSDIDPEEIGNGSVVIIISLVMSVLQFGEERTRKHSRDVLAVFEAAIDPPAPPAHEASRPTRRASG